MEKLNVTSNELTLLNTILNSCFHDGDNPVNNAVWFENPFSNPATASGVVSSLVKKELIGHQEYDSDNDIIWITQKGFDLLKERNNA